MSRSKYWYALGREGRRGRQMAPISTEGRALGVVFGLSLLVGLGIALYLSIVAKQTDLAIWIGFPIMLAGTVLYFVSTWLKGDRNNLAEDYRSGKLSNVEDPPNG